MFVLAVLKMSFFTIGRLQVLASHECSECNIDKTSEHVFLKARMVCIDTGMPHKTVR